MQKIFLVTFVFGLVLSLPPNKVISCERCANYNFLCCDIPQDNLFYLTSFTGGESMACGGFADGSWYYSTSWVRWYCGAKLAVTNPDSGECVVVEVADAGPAAWVEERAGFPILDASPLVCRDLFNSNSCGWSDRFIVEVIQVDDDTPTGPGNCPERCEAVLTKGTPLIIDENERCFRKLCRRSNNAWWHIGNGYNGDSIFTYATNEDSYDCMGEWKFRVVEQGNYFVEVHISNTNNKSERAPYLINTGNSSFNFILNQNNVTGWTPIGEFEFTITEQGSISLFDNTGEPLSLHKKVVYDAIRITYIEEEPIVDGGGGDPEINDLDSDPTELEEVDGMDSSDIVVEDRVETEIKDRSTNDSSNLSDIPSSKEGEKLKGGCSCRVI